MMKDKELTEAIKCCEELFEMREKTCGSIPPYESSTEAKSLRIIVSCAKTNLAVMRVEGMPTEKVFGKFSPAEEVYDKNSNCDFNYVNGYNACHTDFIAWLSQRVDVQELFAMIINVVKSPMILAPEYVTQIVAALRSHILGQKGEGEYAQ